MTHRTHSNTNRGDMMQFHWKPMEAKELAHYINHNTIVGTDRVVIHRLNDERNRDIWDFKIPQEHELLVSSLFDLSLFNNIVGYEMGLSTVEDSLEGTYYGTDVILVTSSPNGRTNITREVMDAISERYKPICE